MGKFANQINWEHFQPLQAAPEPDEPEYQEPLTEAERASIWDDYEPRRVILGDEMYPPGIRTVRLGVGR